MVYKVLQTLWCTEHCTLYGVHSTAHPMTGQEWSGLFGKVAIYAQDTSILLGILTYFKVFRDTFILLGIQEYLYTLRGAFILFGIQGYLYTFKELGILAYCRHVLILFRIEQPLI